MTRIEARTSAHEAMAQESSISPPMLRLDRANVTAVGIARGGEFVELRAKIEREFGPISVDVRTPRANPLLVWDSATATADQETTFEVSSARGDPTWTTVLALLESVAGDEDWSILQDSISSLEFLAVEKMNLPFVFFCLVAHLDATKGAPDASWRNLLASWRRVLRRCVEGIDSYEHDRAAYSAPSIVYHALETQASTLESLRRITADDKYTRIPIFRSNVGSSEAPIVGKIWPSEIPTDVRTDFEFAKCLFPAPRVPLKTASHIIGGGNVSSLLGREAFEEGLYVHTLAAVTVVAPAKGVLRDENGHSINTEMLPHIQCTIPRRSSTFSTFLVPRLVFPLGLLRWTAVAARRAAEFQHDVGRLRDLVDDADPTDLYALVSDEILPTGTKVASFRAELGLVVRSYRSQLEGLATSEPEEWGRGEHLLLGPRPFRHAGTYSPPDGPLLRAVAREALNNLDLAAEIVNQVFDELLALQSQCKLQVDLRLAAKIESLNVVLVTLSVILVLLALLEAKGII